MVAARYLKSLFLMTRNYYKFRRVKTSTPGLLGNIIYNLVLVVVAIRKGVDVGVVDQGVVAISPGELLGPKNKKFNVKKAPLLSPLT